MIPKDHPIISPAALAKLNAMGYRGPKDGNPEVTRFVDGEACATLKKSGNFSLMAHLSEQFCHIYTVFNLAHFPGIELHDRPGYAGPVPVVEVRTILEEDLDRLPEFEERLLRAAQALKG